MQSFTFSSQENNVFLIWQKCSYSILGMSSEVPAYLSFYNRPFNLHPYFWKSRSWEILEKFSGPASLDFFPVSNLKKNLSKNNLPSANNLRKTVWTGPKPTWSILVIFIDWFHGRNSKFRSNIRNFILYTNYSEKYLSNT